MQDGLRPISKLSGHTRDPDFSLPGSGLFHIILRRNQLLIIIYFMLIIIYMHDGHELSIRNDKCNK